MLVIMKLALEGKRDVDRKDAASREIGWESE
jgi:hypothetical protein